MFALVAVSVERPSAKAVEIYETRGFPRDNEGGRARSAMAATVCLEDHAQKTWRLLDTSLVLRVGGREAPSPAPLLHPASNPRESTLYI